MSTGKEREAPGVEQPSKRKYTVHPVLTVSFNRVEFEASSEEEAKAKASEIASEIFTTFVVKGPEELMDTDHYVSVYDCDSRPPGPTYEYGELLAEVGEPD